ncbi:hypothetical protein JXO59_08690 [candidate division KSB1 bacterium]|nr:hypothetical protein [candidate division KSB1 bacterium]
MFFISAAQQQSSDVDRALSQAMQLYQNDQLERAASLLNKTLDKNPEALEVMQLLAQIEMDRERWGKAKGLYKKLKEKRPRDLLPRYALGICYRETGKYKALLLRMLDWRKSRQYFEYVLAKDRSYRDVFTQYALLQRYRGQYFSSVDLAERQLLYNPSAENAAVELFRSYDLLLFHEDASRVQSWLQKRDNPGAQYMLAELARRQEKYQAADSIFQTLMAKSDLNISRIPIMLSLIRMSVQQNQALTATRHFRTTLDSLKDMTDLNLLFEDMHYAFSDDDLNNYSRLKTLDAKKRFLEVFWIKRDPLPAAEENIRLTEHFRRLVYSEAYYRFDGFRLEFNNPDKLHYLKFPRVFGLNQKFNDKGLIYIRHGKPHERAFSMGSNVIQNESWVYYRDGRYPKMMFHFFIDENAIGNNWRLGAEISREMLESRLMLDPIFQQMYMADYMERLRYESEIAMRSKEDVEVGLNTDRHSWSEDIKPIEFPYGLAAFRGENNRTLYDATLALPFQNVWPSKKEYKPEHALSFGFAVFDPQWQEIYKKNWQTTASDIKHMADSLGSFIEQISFETSATLMYISIFINLSEENKVGGYRFNYHGKQFDYSRFAMSDIVLSNYVSPSSTRDSFSKHGLKVLPNPMGRFSKKEPLYVYFELYNLPGREGKSVDFTLQYRLKLLKKHETNIFTQLYKLFSKEREETSNLVQRFADREMSVEYLALDLDKKTSGRYQLEVTAHIPTTDQRVSSTTEFDLH